MTFKTNLIDLLQSQRARFARLDAERTLDTSSCMTASAFTEQVRPDNAAALSDPGPAVSANLEAGRFLKSGCNPSAPSVRQREMLQLLALPNGIRCSVLASKLGWKIPSVRAAICRLRASGHGNETVFSPKYKETIYRSCKPPAGKGCEKTS
ncbi:hypothetical protein [Roseibium algae]|uniref:Uncharacterized protein n=1 Tax=Roseibium algae TaxID=3123038 RepID=A0ABU8TGX1_9HYPH